MFAPIRFSYADRTNMKITNHAEPSTERFSAVGSKPGAIFTDSHFLIPLVVFCVGLALLIILH